MIRNQMTSNRGWKFIMQVLSAAVVFATPAFAQSSQSAAASTASFAHVYDVTKEVKVEGTIQKIETDGKVAPIGTHFLVQTAQGVVDAHLGSSAAAQPSYLGVSEGESVTLVGMMETIGGNQILVARLLTTPNRIFVLRNEHGIPVRGVGGRSLRASQTQKGGI